MQRQKNNGIPAKVKLTETKLDRTKEDSCGPLCAAVHLCRSFVNLITSGKRKFQKIISDSVGYVGFRQSKNLKRFSNRKLAIRLAR